LTGKKPWTAIAIIAVFAIGVLVSPGTAHAADFPLKYCATTSFSQSLPASTNFHSGQWSTGGRFCSFKARHQVRVKCIEDGIRWSYPQLQIIADTGPHQGERTQYDIRTDGTTYTFWNAAYPGPNDSNDNWYHVHMWEHHTTPDATFDNCNIRIGL
jgi:hypothetical protein